MSELEELPSWAGRSTEEVQRPPTPPEEPEVAAPEAPAMPTADAPAEEPPPEAPAEPQAPVEPTTEVAAPAPSAPPAVVADPPPVAAEPLAQTTAPVADIAAPTAAAATSALAAEPAPTQVAYTQPPLAPPRRRGLRTILLVLLGLAILAGAAAAGYLLASSGDSDETAATDGAADTATDEPAGASATDPATDDATSTDATSTDDEAGDGTATDGATTDDATGEGAEDGSQTVTVEVDEDAAEGTDDASTDDSATEEPAEDGDAALNDGNRQAFFRGGVVYLTGAVPSEEIGELIVSRAAAVVGPDNVVNEYEIDPTVTIEPGESAPLYVEDVILFEFNSVEVATPFLPILDLGTLLLRQNPQATVTVVTRTDAVGSEEVNLEVSQRRAQAVINYWLGRGVDPDQIIADPRGEEGASEDDDAETAATQRRAEFIITGLLD